MTVSDVRYGTVSRGDDVAIEAETITPVKHAFTRVLSTGSVQRSGFSLLLLALVAAVTFYRMDRTTPSATPALSKQQASFLNYVQHKQSACIAEITPENSFRVEVFGWSLPVRTIQSLGVFEAAGALKASASSEAAEVEESARQSLVKLAKEARRSIATRRRPVGSIAVRDSAQWAGLSKESKEAVLRGMQIALVQAGFEYQPDWSIVVNASRVAKKGAGDKLNQTLHDWVEKGKALANATKEVGKAIGEDAKEAAKEVKGAVEDGAKDVAAKANATKAEVSSAVDAVKSALERRAQALRRKAQRLREEEEELEKAEDDIKAREAKVAEAEKQSSTGDAK